MRGDFSRRTFRPERHYSAVLLQQGRVVLDADWNEQAALQLRALRQVMQDLVGPHGGPEQDLGFQIDTSVEGDEIVLVVGRGRYYVDGIGVEHADESSAGLTLRTGITRTNLDRGALVVFLEVWERHVTFVEENVAFQRRSLREVALGGPDTASRSEVRFRVGFELQRETTPSDGGSSAPTASPSAPPASPGSVSIRATFRDPNDEAGGPRVRFEPVLPRKGTLAASLTTQDIGPGDPCRDTAQPRYRGVENRLYRVEIHQAEVLGEGEGRRGPTFKWSRENGSVVYPIVLAAGQTTFTGRELVVEVDGLGRDDRYRLRRGDLVELVTQALDEASDAGPLLAVKDIDDDARTVTLTITEEDELGSLPVTGWALLRRWDQPRDPKKANGASAGTESGAIEIDGGDEFLLEDGIVVRFTPPSPPAQLVLRNQPDSEVVREVQPAGPEPYGFRAGDYWLIPARTIPGDIEWPREQGERGGGVSELPHGVVRHVAPLAILERNPDQPNGLQVRDLRRRFSPLATGV